jgi:hypothetical protein
MGGGGREVGRSGEKRRESFRGNVRGEYRLRKRERDG